MNSIKVSDNKFLYENVNTINTDVYSHGLKDAKLFEYLDEMTDFRIKPILYKDCTEVDTILREILLKTK